MMELLQVLIVSLVCLIGGLIAWQQWLRYLEAKEESKVNAKLESDRLRYQSEVTKAERYADRDVRISQNELSMMSDPPENDNGIESLLQGVLQNPQVLNQLMKNPQVMNFISGLGGTEKKT